MIEQVSVDMLSVSVRIGVCVGWIGFEERAKGWCTFEYVS